MERSKPAWRKRLHAFFFPQPTVVPTHLPRGDMTIGEFYDADPRRRETNTPYGEDWSLASDPGYRFDVFWIEATGELFTMRAGKPSLMNDGLGEIVIGRSPDPTVEVLGKLSHEQVDVVMAGWKNKVGEPNSLHWVKQRIHQVLSKHVPEA